MSTSPDPNQVPEGWHLTSALDFVCVLLRCPVCDAPFAVVQMGPWTWIYYDMAAPFQQLFNAFGPVPVCNKHAVALVAYEPDTYTFSFHPKKMRRHPDRPAASYWLACKAPNEQASGN